VSFLYLYSRTNFSRNFVRVLFPGFECSVTETWGTLRFIPTQRAGGRVIARDGRMDQCLLPMN
jgi:hypothetical protein